jgi:fibronectin-binding autotransporter adhesin
VLTGHAGSATLDSNNNSIGAIDNFTAGGDLTLVSDEAMTITGTLDVSGHTLTLTDTGGGIDASAGAIEAATLTGSSTGAALFTDASNAIGTLAGFTNTGGAFSLTDSIPLAITGTLNATGQTVTLVDSTGGIDASAGVIEANELTGSTKGQALFTDASNVINTLGTFTNTSGQFSLTDTVALTVTGTLDATGQALTFSDTGGGVDASAAMVDAAVLQGSTDGAALFTNAANQIGAVGFFTNTSGAFSLTDNTPLVIGATLDATGQTVTLIDNNGGIDGSVGEIKAATLTGSSTGDATFTGPNVIGALNGFTNTSGDFSLTDSVALTITGTLDAIGHTVTVADTGAGIDASAGEIEAATLTGSSMGDALFTDASNAIGTLNGFETNGNNFVLSDTTALTITGTLDAAGQTVTLVNTGGGIDASAGVINAATLTGSSTGDALFTDATNTIGTLASFTNTSGAFALTDTTPLTITGRLNAGQQSVTLDDTGGSIDESLGEIDAGFLTGSTVGAAVFTGQNNVVETLNGFSNTQGDFSLTDRSPLTITGTLNVAGHTVTLDVGGDGVPSLDCGGVCASTGADLLGVEIDAAQGTIIADVLTGFARNTGSSPGTALFTDGSNEIATLASFTTAGGFALTDSVPLTITGTLNATGQTVTLNDTNGGIDASAGVIEAATLTGSTTGVATFIDASNQIGTLNGFTNTSGAFSLTDNAPLTVTGTLNATGQTVTLNDTNGGIDASNGVIDAATLTGSTTGTALFTDASNQIGTLNGFTNTSGAFSLTDNAPLAVTGTLNATGQTVTLVDTNGGIDASAVVIEANTLTGSTTGTALFTGASNAIGTLNGFTNTSGSFSLTDNVPLSITGTLNVTGQTLTLVDTGGGIDASNGVVDAAVLTGSTTGNADFSNPANAIGTFTGFTNTSGSLSLTDTLPLTLTGTIGAAGETVTLVDTGGGIDASGAVIDAAVLTGSTTGNALFTDASNQIGTLAGFTNTNGAFSLTDTTPLTITGTLNATGQTVTLVNTGGGIDASAGAIDAATLTGSTTGAATFTNASNAIGTLAGFTNTAGAFSLTDSTALTMTGTLNAAGQTVTLNDTGGGIDASAGQIIASTLTGSANGDALFSNGANQIGTFADFTDNAGSVSLADSIALTITGTIDPTTLTLVDTGGGIDSSGAAIIADTLTGSTTGMANFTNAGNDIGTLSTFTNTQGAFSLTDSVALKVTGTLNAAGQTVTLVDTGGGIDASQGAIDAATLTGSTMGAATFTNAANAIGTLNGFETNGNAFALTDSAALTMTATLDAAGQIVTLVDTGGAIDASHGVINAATLTGSTAGNATFTANNTIGVLDAFQAGGSLSLTDAEALAVNGADVSGLGFTGVSAGKTGNLTVDVTGNLTLASNIATGGNLTLSSSGNVALNSGAITAGSVDVTAAGNYTQTNGTIAGTTLASVTATSGNIIINGGSISGATVDLTAGQNILIGEQAFTALALNDAPGSIDQIKDPILPLTVGVGGGLYEASAPYQNHVFVTTETLNLTAPQRIVSENTGTMPESGGGYAPNGIVINQQTTPLPTAISIDGGAGASGTRPQVADLFAVLMQGTSIIGAEDIADSAQIVFGPDTSKNNAYQINGCIIHNLNSCTIVSFTIKPMDPNKQADLVIIPGGDQDEDELDLTISGEGNDEIWEDEE